MEEQQELASLPKPEVVLQELAPDNKQLEEDTILYEGPLIDPED